MSALSLDGRASMTFLRHTNNCPRSGYLYELHKRTDRQSVEMLRGTAVHSILERALRTMVEERELSMPPELLKAIVSEVLAETWVPVEEHDYIRELAYRWGAEWRLRPDERVVSVERLFVLELAGWQVRCKVDLATADELNRVYVADWKSGRGAPAYDEVTRKRPDGTLAAKAFQLILYSLAIVFGRPADECGECDGSGEGWGPITHGGDGRPGREREGVCPACDGAGYVLGEQVARGCEEVLCEYVFPGIEDGEGNMLRRTAGLTRLELLEYRESLELLLGNVERWQAEAAAELVDEETGERKPVTMLWPQTGAWPAVVSDAACDECPCPQACPIPEVLRDNHGSINTPEEAAEALQRRHVRSVRDRAVGRELRAFLDKQLGGGPLRYGNRVAEIVPVSSVEVRDKEGLYQALASGMPLEEARDKFEKRSTGTRFVERDLKPEEFVNEKEAVDG